MKKRNPAVEKAFRKMLEDMKKYDIKIELLKAPPMRRRPLRVPEAPYVYIVDYIHLT